MISDKLKALGMGFELGSGGFKEDRPTLVMIHGAGGHAQIWHPLISLIQDAVNPLALDLPGHGESKGPGMVTIGDYATWVSEALRGLFEKPVYVLGHSLGGAIVQELVLSFPHLVKGIVLVSTGPRLQVAPMFLEGLKGSFEQTVDSLIGYAYGPSADRAMILEGARLMKSAGSSVVHGDFSACNIFDRRKDVGRITSPCLIVCGDKDKLTPPALSRSLQEAIHGSALEIIPSAGHMVMIEAPEALSRVVKDFVLKRA